MSNYQRLISYIYTYEGGIRGKNIGFAKLETRGSQCRITVNVKKIFVGGNPVGVFLLAGQDEVKIGTLFARNGAGEFRTVVNTADVENSGHSLEECYGLSVHDVESAWRSYTTIWEDAVAHAAEVELADVTAEKVALKQEGSVKEQTVLQEEETEQELLPISREIEEQLKKEAEAEKPAPKAAEAAVEETAPVQEAERIAPLSSEIPRPKQMNAAPSEDSMAPGSLREMIMAQVRQDKIAMKEEEPLAQMEKMEISKPEAGEQEETEAPPQAVKKDAPEAEIQNTKTADVQTPVDEMETVHAPGMAIQGEKSGRTESRYSVPQRETPSGKIRKETPGAFGSESAGEKPSAPSEENASVPPSGVAAPYKELSDVCSEQEVWEMMRKKYPKILAFDYVDGCEVLTIKPQDIGLLPREEWVYGSNSFLLHGYYNYRYLILARLNNPEGKARYLLGVPGHYLSNEKYMASMFGFSNFVLAKKQPPRDGRFGYWYTDVKIGD